MRTHLPAIPLALLFLLINNCSNPDNPFEDPANVKVSYFIKDSLLVAHPDSTFLVGDTVCVGLSFQLPHLIDTCTISMNTDTSFSVPIAGIKDGDSVWLSYAFSSPGQKMLQLHVAIQKGYRVNDFIPVTVRGKPASIIRSPAEKTVIAGDSVVLFVAAEGTGALTYTWYHNKTILTGRTNDTLIFPSVSLLDSGSYFCVVDNEWGGPDTSDSARLHVLRYTDNLLDSLYPSAGALSPTFKPDSTAYQVNVSYSDSSFSLTAIAHNAKANVAFKPRLPLALSLGDTTVTVTVTSPDSTSKSDYIVRVYRQNNVATLDSLFCSGGTLIPSFVPDSTVYKVKIPRDTTSIRFTVFPTDSHATITQNPPNPITLSKDTTEVRITVASEDTQNARQYKVQVIWKPYTFSKTFGSGYFKAGFQASDGAYYVGGLIDTQGVLLKLSDAGVESKRFSPTGVFVINDILPATDNGFIACGSTAMTYGDGWLAKIDGELNTVGNTLTRGVSNLEDRFETMTAKRGDAGFIAAGEFNWDRSWTTGDALLVTVDAKAAFLSQKSHGGPARDYIMDITQAPNTGYFFVGSYFPTSTAKGLAWICKTTESGDTLTWSKMYGSTMDLGFSSVLALPDGGAYCAGAIQVQASSSSWMPNGYIMRVNANGDSLWTKQHGTAGVSEFFQDITSAHDGGYICVGYQDAKGWMLKIDENGNKVWEKQFSSAGTGYLQSIVKTKQNGYFCTGILNNAAWVLRVDENGNMD
jgi:hypothetical protein